MLVLVIFGAGYWTSSKVTQSKELKIEQEKTKQLVEEHRRQEKQTVLINEQKRTYSNKAKKLEEVVNEEITNSKPEYIAPLPESSRLLIQSAIDQANSYINTVK